MSRALYLLSTSVRRRKERKMGGLIVPKPYARALKEAFDEGRAIKGNDIMPKIRRATGLTKGEKQLRCGDCKCMDWIPGRIEWLRRCVSPAAPLDRRIAARPGQYAGECYVYPDK